MSALALECGAINLGQGFLGFDRCARLLRFCFAKQDATLDAAAARLARL